MEYYAAVLKKEWDKFTLAGKIFFSKCSKNSGFSSLPFELMKNKGKRDIYT